MVITLIMEAVSTSETLVNIYQTTWCNIPEDSHIHNHCRKNLKSHKITVIFQTPQSQTTTAFGFTPIANMTSPTPVMMSGMMSPPPMMVPTIPLYTPTGIVLCSAFLYVCSIKMDRTCSTHSTDEKCTHTMDSTWET
jgi:hypothetical protein